MYKRDQLLSLNLNKVQFITNKVKNTSYKIRNDQRNNDQTKHVVHVQVVVLLKDLLNITILRLQRFQQLTESGNVD